jgi:rod shape-determining protein MreC
MNWLSSLFSRYWRNFHFISILLLSLILIFNNQTINTFVSQITVSVFYYPFSVVRNSVDELIQVNEENRRLRSALVETSVKLSMLEEARQENVRLREVLGFEPPPGYTLIPAKVISVSGEKIPVSAVINRGRHDSLVMNLPIINQAGLIGRVVEVMDDYATVQLLTDPTHRVAARVADSREMGIVKYNFSQGMILDNFPVQGSIAVGDKIISSGLGGIYPPGLLVGTVARVVRLEEDPFCEISIISAANFNSIEDVFILKPEKI